MMEMLVLGILMMHGATIYEMRQYIQLNLSTVSSTSLGSIQAGIKKLLEREMIVFKEDVENGIYKKVYFITEKGEEYFKEKVSEPMLYKTKNKEFFKLFFMGHANTEKYSDLIQNYIDALNKELTELETVNLSIGNRYEVNEGILSMIQRLRSQGRISEEISDKEFVDENMRIARFTYATLDFGIDQVKFEIEWFKKFKKQLEREEAFNDNK